MGIHYLPINQLIDNQKIDRAKFVVFFDFFIVKETLTVNKLFNCFRFEIYHRHFKLSPIWKISMKTLKRLKKCGFLFISHMEMP